MTSGEWAAALAIVVSAIQAPIELWRSNARIFWRRAPLWFYVLILALGNAFTTLLAASFFEDMVPNGFPPVVWYLVLGVFGFEMVLKRINVTFSGVGVLSLSEWITKAKEAAIADLVEAGIDENQAKVQSLADRLKELPEADLNAHVVTILGKEMPHELEEAAKAGKADPSLVKALTLAYTDFARASAIKVPSRLPRG